jgi:hypothetical protein
VTTLKQFNVYVDNKVGELARVTEALAQNAINIRGLATERPGIRSTVKVVTDDEVSTRAALKRAGLSFDESEVLVIDLMDHPGEIAKVAKRAAQVGVNIDSVFLIGKNDMPAALAVGTSDPKKAKRLMEKGF